MGLGEKGEEIKKTNNQAFILLDPYEGTTFLMFYDPDKVPVPGIPI